MDFLLAAFIATVVGTTASVVQAKEAQEKQEDAQDKQDAIALSRRQAERRREVRKARILRGQQEQGAVTSGVAGSSSAISAQGTTGSNLSDFLGQSAFTDRMAAGISADLKSAGDAQFRSSAYRAVGQLASSGFKAADAGLFDSIFNKPEEA